MNSAQVGAQNTRAMHPQTLLRLERILETILERPIRLEAPFLLATKGELCKRAGVALKGLAQVSNSCDETERNKRNTNEHCGVCTSCLLRRVALHAALGSDDPTPYRKNETKRSGQYEINAFEEQANRFSAISSYRELLGDDPDVRWAVQYLERHGMAPTGRTEAEAQLLALLHRHATEVKSFYAHQGPQISPNHKRAASMEKNSAFLGPDW